MSQTTRTTNSIATKDKIKAYIDLTKPTSSIGVMLTIPFATIMYAELSGLDGIQFLISNINTVIYASVTVFLLHGGSQSMNMAEDAFMDKKTNHKSERPIPSGIVSEDEARSLAWILIFVGVARAFTITSSFGLFAAVLGGMGVMYNLSPIRAKEILWVNIIWQALSRGLFLFPATFSVWGDPLNPVAWAFGIIAFLLVLSMQQTADFADVEIDEKFNIITPAVEYGLDSIVKIMTAIAILMFATYTVFLYFSVIPQLYSVYLLALPIGWSLYSLWSSPQSISNIGSNHLSWYVFYISIASLFMLPALELVIYG